MLDNVYEAGFFICFVVKLVLSKCHHAINVLKYLQCKYWICICNLFSLTIKQMHFCNFKLISKIDT